MHFDTNVCETLCAIWYHLHNLKKVKKTHGRVLSLVKLEALKVKYKSHSASLIVKM